MTKGTPVHLDDLPQKSVLPASPGNSWTDFLPDAHSQIWQDPP